MKVAEKTPKPDHKGQMLRRNSLWMSLEASTWSVNSGTFFMSVGNDRSGRLSPLCMLKGSGRRQEQGQCHHTRGRYDAE